MGQNYQRGSKELTNILIQDSVIMGNVGIEPTIVATSELPIQNKVPIRQIRTIEENDELALHILKIIKRFVPLLNIPRWSEQERSNYLYLATHADIKVVEQLEEQLTEYKNIYERMRRV
jgi:hypothetical protein